LHYFLFITPISVILFGKIKSLYGLAVCKV
jgi:hypothetical protein